MKNRTYRLRFMILCWVMAFVSCVSANFDPEAIYLTWRHSPETTMTIMWLSPANRQDDVLQYRQADRQEWMTGYGAHRVFPEGRNQTLIHSVELSGLKPATDYVFRPGTDAVTFKFRTMPQTLDKPLRFIVGGDFYHKKMSTMERSNHIAAAYNPAFVMIGGDIAYAVDRDGVVEDTDRWVEFLKAWKQDMVTCDGRLIPMVPTIGNHEVKGRYGQTPEAAQVYYALFGVPGSPGYRVIDFGDYLSVFLLDTGHTHPIPGAQAEWLNSALQSRVDRPTKFALYHVPAYPSVREDGEVNQEIRAAWLPSFDRYGLTAAFENHEHAYKRSHPIFNNHIDSQGTLYLGDGGWGVKPRVPATPEQRWYLAKSASKQYFMVVDLSEQQRRYTAVDGEGAVFDQFVQNVTAPVEAVRQ